MKTIHGMPAIAAIIAFATLGLGVAFPAYAKSAKDPLSHTGVHRTLHKLALQAQAVHAASEFKLQRPLAKVVGPPIAPVDVRIPVMDKLALQARRLEQSRAPKPRVGDQRAAALLRARVDKLTAAVQHQREHAAAKAATFPRRRAKAAGVPPEVDEDADGAPELTFAQGADGYLSPVGDVDTWVFSAQEGQSITIHLDSDEFDTYVELEYDEEVIAFDDDSGSGYNSLVEGLVLPATGEYTVRVHSYHDGQAGAYHLLLEEERLPLVDGGPLTEGETTAILTPDEPHVYFLTVDALTELVIDVVSADFDSYLSLFAGDRLTDVLVNGPLFTDDDGGEGTNSHLELVLEPGAYLVHVRGYRSSAEGAFTVSLHTVTQVTDEDLDGPSVVAAGEIRAGALLPAGDQDRFSFTGTEGDLISVSLTSADFDAYLEIFFDESRIAQDDDNGSGRNSLIEDFALPADGEYIILVRSYDQESEGEYQLEISSRVSPFISMGQMEEGERQGALEAGQLHLYTFTLGGLTQTRIDLRSGDFDTYLVLYEGGSLSARLPGNRVASDDDGGDGLNSRLDLDLTAGTYLIEARALTNRARGDYVLELSTVALAEDEDQDGPLPLAFGESREGELSPSGDTDLYVFSGRAGQVVAVGLSSTDFDAYLGLEMDGEVIAADDDDGPGLNSLIDEFVLPVDGQYLIHAHSLGDRGTGSYQVYLENLTPALQLQEPLTAGAASGVLDEEALLHLYPLVIPSLSQVEIALDSREFDAFLVLYQGSGAQDRTPERVVAQDDDSGPGLNSRIRQLLSPGSYLIEARSLDGTRAGAYTLTFSSSPVMGDEDDPRPLAAVYGQQLQGSLTPVGDRDTYTFSGQAGDVIDLDLVSGDFDAYLRLVLDGEVLASDDDGGVDLNSRIHEFVLASDGEYHVVAGSYADGGTGAYTLTLTNATPPLALGDSLEVGKYTGELTQAREVHLFPLRLEHQSTVDLGLTSASFSGHLALYTGATAADRRAASLAAEATGQDGEGADIHVLLPAATYLVEVTAADGQDTGEYELQLSIADIQSQDHDRLTLVSGTINGEPINALLPVARLAPGEKITGILSLQVYNSRPASEIFPLGATPSWGPPETSYWQVCAWAPVGHSSYDVALDLMAPEEPGTYHLIFAAAAEPAVSNIMSGTHWETADTSLWRDDDDVATWSDSLLNASTSGFVTVPWHGGYQAQVAATVVRLEVVAPVAIGRGPASLDLDTAAGDQGQEVLTGVSAGDTICVQLHIHDVEEISGWSAQLEFDPDLLAYVSDSFAPGDFITGLMSLVLPREDAVEVGGAVLGTAVTASGDGFLGTARFVVQPGFSGQATLSMTRIALRTVDRGQVKQNVLVAARVEAGEAVSAGPVTLDFDLASGDQGQNRSTGAAVGDVVQVQLHIADAPLMRGWSVRVEFDPTAVAYVSGSFQPSSFVPGMVPLVGEKEGLVEVGGTVLVGDGAAEGDGELGTLSFTVLEGFADSTELAIVRVGVNTADSGEVSQTVRSTAVISAMPDANALTADFSGDGTVDFSDFFLFADRFGSTAGNDDWDPAYDLTGDGVVDFSDFFIFADQFGSDTRGKLMALAHQYLGLPLAASLEESYPNPFNSATTIRFRLGCGEQVLLEVFTPTGQRVKRLLSAYRHAGVFSVVWDGTDSAGRPVSSGVYLCRLRAGSVVQVGKMLYLK